jgi:hypothetical protein
MKVSEKSLELNLGAEILSILRNAWRMPKAYLRGLTQREEKAEGVDFFAQLIPSACLLAFQFKAPRGRTEVTPYRYTLVSEQHDLLFSLAQTAQDAVFYVFPFYVTPAKLQRDVPRLAQDTWLLRVAQMPTFRVFGSQKTKSSDARPVGRSLTPSILSTSCRTWQPLNACTLPMMPRKGSHRPISQPGTSIIAWLGAVGAGGATHGLSAASKS